MNHDHLTGAVRAMRLRCAQPSHQPAPGHRSLRTSSKPRSQATKPRIFTLYRRLSRSAGSCRVRTRIFMKSVKAHTARADRPPSHSWRRLGALAFLAVSATAGSAHAADPGVRLELNRLEPQGESCRTYLLIDNAKGDAFTSLKLDLFAFDTDGVIAKRLALESGPVPASKTASGCSISPASPAGVSRVLLNDVSPARPRPAQGRLLGRVETASKHRPRCASTSEARAWRPITRGGRRRPTTFRSSACSCRPIRSSRA